MRVSNEQNFRVTVKAITSDWILSSSPNGSIFSNISGVTSYLSDISFILQHAQLHLMKLILHPAFLLSFQCFWILSICLFLQDDDGYLLRMQPADSLASSRLSLARRKRMGRFGQRTSRRIHNSSTSRRQTGFINSNMQHLPTFRSGWITTTFCKTQKKLVGPAHRSASRMEWNF